MDFRTATDRLSSCPTHDDIAAATGVTRNTVARARLEPGTDSYRSPPAGWEAALAQLAQNRARALQGLCEELRGDTSLTEPEEASKIRDRLYKDVAVLADLWRQYQLLFTSADTVAFLNERAGWFFGTVQRALIQEIVLYIARLTDPAGRNLSLSSLLRDRRVQENPKLRKRLQRLLNEVAEFAAPLRRHRNKFIAHRDHATAMGLDALPHVGWPEVDVIIQRITAVHRDYSDKLLQVHTDYDGHPFGDAKELLDVLKSAPSRAERLRAEDEAEARDAGGGRVTAGNKTSKGRSDPESGPE